MLVVSLLLVSFSLSLLRTHFYLEYGPISYPPVTVLKAFSNSVTDPNGVM